MEKILDFSKLKEFTDNNLKRDKNSGKFSKRVENTVGKGEIACYDQFLLFPQVFSKNLSSRNIKTKDCLRRGQIFSILVTLVQSKFCIKEIGFVQRKEVYVQLNLC